MHKISQGPGGVSISKPNIWHSTWKASTKLHTHSGVQKRIRDKLCYIILNYPIVSTAQWPNLIHNDTLCRKCCDIIQHQTISAYVLANPRRYKAKLLFLYQDRWISFCCFSVYYTGQSCYLLFICDKLDWFGWWNEYFLKICENNRRVA